MIICPQCGDRLTQALNAFHCTACGETIASEGTIHFFHRQDVGLFENHSEEALTAIMACEEHHFWFRSRAEFVSRQLRRFVQSDHSFADIGAGSGLIAGRVTSWCSDVSAVDMQPIGLQRARARGIAQLYQMNLDKCLFVKHFDAVGLFDVMEHFDDEARVLEHAGRMLKPGGLLFITVPALSCLWNKRDILEQHRRRYGLAQLTALLEDNRFEVIDSRYFFFAITPLLYLRALWYRLFPSPPQEGDHLDDVKINPVLNVVLYLLMRLENAAVARLKPPVGGSILAVARKR